MNYSFIINKTAGSGKFQMSELCEKIKDAASSLNIADKVKCYFTTKIGDAIEYVRSIKTGGVPHTFIACGGDGTFREVVNGAMANGSPDIAVGVIPCGTGNDFVRAFAHDEAFLDIKAQLSASIEAIDVMEIDGEYCINLANMGFDANVADNMQRYKKRFGKLSYEVAVIRELFSKSRFPMTVTFDDTDTISGDYILLSVANGMAYGGGYYAAPLSSMKDGVLDVTYCDMITKLKLITVIGDYKAGKHLCKKYESFIHRRTAKHVKIKFGRPISVSQDGEITQKDSLDIKVIPGGIRFSLPKGCDFKNQ